MDGIHEQRKWREIITPNNRIFSLNVREIWNYRDLLLILIRRDILAIYKQTILGPLWFFLQPILVTITFMIIFSRVAKLPTGGMPPLLFYLSGLVLWSYFSECITRSSTFLKDSSPILSKVYFPRLIVPLSLIITNLVKFSIQLLVFFIVYVYYLFSDSRIEPNNYIWLLPVLIILTAGLGLGAGILIASLTTKYKDLAHLTSFGVQLLMFASPVIFPLSGFEGSPYELLIKANPMTGIIEAFRYAFLGSGSFDWGLLAYDACFVLVSLCLGIIVFNKVERKFIDTI